MRYGPGMRAATRYTPSSFVVRSIETPVSTLTIVTVAPGRAAPVLSFTKPELVLLPVWAKASSVTETASTIQLIRTNRDGNIPLLLLLRGWRVSRATDREKRSNRGVLTEGTSHRPDAGPLHAQRHTADAQQKPRQMQWKAIKPNDF